MSAIYDLVVIGAGPGGYEAAAHAGRMGRRVAVVEERHIGGVCLNVGCIPTKAFLRSARLFAECRLAGAFGVRVGEPEFDLPAVVERKNRVVGTLTRGVETLLKKSGVEMIRGRGRLVRGGVAVGSDRLEANNVLLATGSRPAVPPIPGIGRDLVKDSTAVLELTRLPEGAVVIGGGYIGLEFAGFFASAGVPVTVLEMLPEVAAGMDVDAAAALREALGEAGVTFMTSCRVTGIEAGAVRCLDAAGAPQTLAADCVVNATGRTPVLENLGLEEAYVDFDRRGVRTSSRGKTNVPGLWACGDVTGRKQLAHVAAREGIVAVNNMFGCDDRMRYEAVPSVIYTHPEVASVGPPEQELRRQGVPYRKATAPMAVSGRFLIEHERPHGFVKVLVGERYGEILGVHAVGDAASEFIVAAAVFIGKEMLAADAAEIVFPHPTVSEVLREAVIQAARHRS